MILTLTGSDSPPIMVACSVSDYGEEMLQDSNNADDLQSHLVHHPSHSVEIYGQCPVVRVECEVATKTIKVGKYVDQNRDHTDNMQSLFTGRLREL